MTRIARELGVRGERRRREVEEPGRDDAAAAPYLGNLGKIKVEAQLLWQPRGAGVLHDVEALGDRLHHAVLDAVVDHFDEMAGAAGAGMQVALLGAPISSLAAGGGWNGPSSRGQRSKDRIEPVHHRRFAADHQAVAAFQSPHAARGANVEVVEAMGRELAGTSDIVLPERVAAIDDRVPALELTGELVDRRFRRCARRQHDPNRARGIEGADHLGEVGGNARAVVGERAARLRIAVVNDARVALPQETTHDIGPHAAEPNHADLHGTLLFPSALVQDGNSPATGTILPRPNWL